MSTLAKPSKPAMPLRQFLNTKKWSKPASFVFLLSLLSPVVSTAEKVNSLDSSPKAVIDTGKFYERKGMCLAQKDPASKAKCLDKLLSEVLSSVSESNKLLPSNQNEVKKSIAKTPEEIKAEKVAEINKKWGGVLRSFASIQSATEVGVNYNQHGILLQNFATEVTLMKDSVDDEKSKEILTLFNDSVSTYQDAATWWGKDIDFYSRSNNRQTYFGGLPFRLVGLDYIFNKYDLPKGNADLFGIHDGVPRNVALVKIWSAAAKLAETSKEKIFSVD